MKKNILALIILAISAFGLTMNAHEWEMKQARIMTPWSETIDVNNVLNEYPRPQLERSYWYNLNGLWDFTRSSKASLRYDANQTFDKKILVPFPMESAISGIMDTDHDENKGKIFIYRRTFSLTDEMKEKQLLLHFGAVDWLCMVYVNGKSVGSHKGGFDPFSFDITSALNATGEQEIQVFVQDHQEFGGYPHGKQKIGEKAIWYTPATGIWQTVWLEPVEATHIEKLNLKPNIDTKRIGVNVRVNNAPSSATAKIKVYDGDLLITEIAEAPVNEEVSIELPSPKLWSPDSPFLYDLKVELYDNDQITDQIDSYFGMRKISKGTFMGKPCILLNNEYIFQYGVLDQGYWPDGIYTAPSDEALKYDLEMTKKFGMNMSRKHIKIEPARWYYHCDRMGLLVWQDIPNPGFGENGKIVGEGSDLRENFHREMTNMIQSLENHPSIVMWVIYNESWGQPGEALTRKAVDIVRELDPDRLISAASGWNDYECGDIKDTHWYPQPNILPNPVNERASVCGEYGGITLFADGHRWQGGSNMTYTQVYSSEDLKNRFIEYVTQMNALQAKGACGAVYTQITDVEDEENGLISYDRRVVKVDESQMAEIRKAVERNYTHTSIEILPTSEDDNVQNIWKYHTSNSPISSNSWKEIEYAGANTWAEGRAGFGAGDPPNSTVRTTWDNRYIYMRRTVDFSKIEPESIENLYVSLYHDEDCDIYINGVLALSVSGFVSGYTSYELTPAGKAAIKPDASNVIAVRCRQTSGGQFIDLGFIAVDVLRAPLHPTGITYKETINSKDLIVYPNPTSNSFSLSEEICASCEISILYPSGQLAKKFPKGTNLFNVKDLEPGVYLVVANSAGKNQKVGKLIVQNI